MHEFITVPIKFNPDLLREFEISFGEALNNQQVDVIVLIGRDNYFCMGMDLDYIATDYAPCFVAQFCNTLKMVRSSSKPVLAKVEGSVIAGGVALLSMVDFIIADEAASFSLPESAFGLTPAIAIACLLERIKPQHIKYLAWTSDAISAKQALEWGLVDKVSSAASLEQDVLLMRHRFSRTPASVIRESRQLLSKYSPFEDVINLGGQLLQDKLKDIQVIEKISVYLENIRLFNDEYARD
ncbi:MULTISPECIES: enoyl-CoA hydratase/isomerase family protein [Serratia]|jgi:enoyl-CoA hydratase/carnithine racemase|uniref:Enoyl-CoA hydratase/isomerase family protein n=1 Tax=Serratia fonticola TaxID=47917 RepID=A0AAW3X221_SERFO|nr:MULTISPECIES: enoyl-CoA hydratase/isomerase family protein [Serratia]ALX97488.1 enoyl-CoA hydratase [Serratia fonticola]MBC3215852.1 enoyl-CoA hydratase/isomerase family protein [Serratia fonticola]NYA15128.1 enoyl-CoA hydratase/isomerase family protein [Serratia fonticola]NYA36507.1 enoyl-CoA hydratase/isomerase family protein [Serratia fonticola]OCJ28949.1 enoyl-CoA hydratase [Serratia sp. 14-2641]